MMGLPRHVPFSFLTTSQWPVLSEPFLRQDATTKTHSDPACLTSRITQVPVPTANMILPSSQHSEQHPACNNKRGTLDGVSRFCYLRIPNRWKLFGGTWLCQLSVDLHDLVFKFVLSIHKHVLPWIMVIIFSCRKYNENSDKLFTLPLFFYSTLTFRCIFMHLYSENIHREKVSASEWNTWLLSIRHEINCTKRAKCAQNERFCDIEGTVPES